MPLTIGQVYKARLQFVIDNLGIAMDVELQVRSFDRQTGRAGCQFRIWSRRIFPPCAT